MPSIDDILSDAEWLPHYYDPASDRVLFTRLSAEARASLTFLSDHKPDQAFQNVWVEGEALRNFAGPSVPVHFIFHSAFCRSTLLSRAVGAYPKVGELREPMIFNHLSDHADNPRVQELVAPIMRLLGRPLTGEATIITKPSNYANRLIPALLACNPDAKTVVIYGKLLDFLNSIAKKGLMGRIWARKQLVLNRMANPIDLGMDARQLYELSDLQTAGLAWLLHMDQFAQVIEQHGSRVTSLPADTFNARREETLAAAARLFGIEAASEETKRIATGPVFASHSKRGGAFDEGSDADQGHGPATLQEFEQVGQWIDMIAQQLQLPQPLPSPLLKEE